MERWSGKLAVVSGASSGIGAAVSLDLAKAGLIVFGLARRVERIEALSSQLTDVPGKVIGIRCDVTDNESVKKAFDWIEENYGGVNIVVNNAGISRPTMILKDDNDAELNLVIDTNLKGLLNTTKAAYRHLQKYDAHGHIINVNSIVGHNVVKFGRKPVVNIYAGSKYAVTATTEVLRQELNYLENHKVRVSSISPGMVDTGIFEAAGLDSSALRLKPILQPADVSQAILFVLSVPDHVQIHELTIRPVGELY